MHDSLRPSLERFHFIVLSLGEYIRREFTKPQQIGIGYAMTEIAIRKYCDESSLENKEELIGILSKHELFDNFQIIKIMTYLDQIKDSDKVLAEWYKQCLIS